ncbi:hypothetical protein A1D31_15465 [Bradyrhizobium liaoningense]|nr:hypothetical protein A1D31_15465 [Bradyrhizobium liaoningense]
MIERGHADHPLARLPFTWWERACFRSELRADIRDRSEFLRDIGVDAFEAHAEARRFFWQPIRLKRPAMLDCAPATAAVARPAVDANGSRYRASASFPIANEGRRFLASIASALRSSRRLQADRILRQYAHLIAHPRQSAAGPT